MLALLLLIQEPSDSELRRHVETLASDEMEGRCTGMPGADRAAEYLAKAFQSRGLRAPSGGYVQEFEVQSIAGTRKSLVGKNVIGFVEGKDAKLRGEYVLVGAHYDGGGRKGDPNPPSRIGGDRADAIWNGADDNASGVAAMLELARLAAASPPARSILFAAFSAEEFDNLGSVHFLRHLPTPVSAEAIVAMVNLHMLGRNPGRALEVLGADSGAEWEELCRAAAKERLEIRVRGESPRSGDQATFAGARVPAIQLFGGFHEDYHAPGDEASKIAWTELTLRTRFADALVRSVADRPGRIRWRRPSWAGQLGIQGFDITDEEAERLGLSAGSGGVRIAEVAHGTPAEEAGLRVDDVLLEFGGRRLTRDGAKAELLRAIQSLRAGEETTAVVLREGKRLTVRFRWPKE